jgi:hypothetical protein
MAKLESLERFQPADGIEAAFKDVCADIGGEDWAKSDRRCGLHYAAAQFPPGYMK